MRFPSDYKYSKEHTWLKLLDNQQTLIGITESAQSELGEIVFRHFQSFCYKGLIVKVTTCKSLS